MYFDFCPWSDITVSECISYSATIFVDYWCCFQATVGSYLGFGSYVNLARPISSTIASWTAVADPEIQVCVRCMVDLFFVHLFCLGHVIHNSQKISFAGQQGMRHEVTVAWTFSDKKKMCIKMMEKLIVKRKAMRHINTASKAMLRLMDFFAPVTLIRWPWCTSLT